jgi:hypothetical protein
VGLGNIPKEIKNKSEMWQDLWLNVCYSNILVSICRVPLEFAKILFFCSARD